MPRNSNDTHACWSRELIEETRRALQTPPITFDGNLSLKNVDGRFGQVGLCDLTRGILQVADRSSGETYVYETVDAVIAAGWAID